MALNAGTRLGPYEITALIGEGGMGEVYRATDTNLKRTVAIKVLPDALASDVERLARLQREAEVLASLNHPHIAQIHGLEKTERTTALVMELVEGPTLADRLAQGPIPVDEALPIARQIAEALEAAHEQGIIHRDLKPANIKVRPDGVVKVLDFGLAKAMGSTNAASLGTSRSPTITTPAMTQAGVVFGTAAYMSPEQARGKPVDRRADLWAFGCVLYEMLTGARAFSGEDVGEVLAAVIKTEVDWDRVAHAPARIQMLARRCLRKDPRQRLGDAGAVRLELEDVVAAPEDTMGSSHRWSVVSLPIALIVGLIVMVASSAITVWLRTPVAPQTASNVAHLTLSVPASTELTDGISVVISPDGTQVAYVASRGGIPQLHLRSLNDFGARPLADTNGAAAPFFSPDGKWLGFFAGGKLKKVSTTGGVVVDLADAPGLYGPAGAWGPADTIVYPGPMGLAEIAASGGRSRSLLPPEQRSRSALFPDFLPDGKTLLVSSASGGDAAEDRSIDLMTLSTGERRVLVQRGIMPRYLPTGHLVFLRGGTLMAVPFDVQRMQTAGSPVEILKGVRQEFFGTFSCSRNGNCVYIPGGALGQRRVTLVDRTGTPRPLPLPPANYQNPRFSPSGDKLSFWMGGRRCDVDIYDIARGTTTRLTSENDNHFPEWAPDGHRIAYISSQRDARGYRLVARSATGGGVEEQLGPAELTVGPLTPISLSPLGAFVFADRGDLWSLSLTSNGQPRPFTQSRFNETSPAFSPDGRWLAYVSDESGRLEVYVQPFPGPGEKISISVGGGSEPVWDRRGRELFFRNGDQMMVVAVNTQPTFSAGRPRPLFTGPFVRSVVINYDVSPDGESFVMLDSGEASGAATEVNVLLNWYEELKRLVPVPK